MTDIFATDTFLFSFIVLPVLIFVSRIADQTLGTIRIIFVSKGMKYLAPILGFFEVILWLIIMRQIFQNLNNALYYISYAAGFGMGNYIGMLIEEKMAMGVALIRIIPQKDSSLLLSHLKKSNFRHTSIKGYGSEGPVDIIFSIIKRKHVGEFTRLIKQFNPKAFFTIEDVKFVNEAQTADGYYRNDFLKMRNLYRQLKKSK